MIVSRQEYGCTVAQFSHFSRQAKNLIFSCVFIFKLASNKFFFSQNTTWAKQNSFKPNIAQEQHLLYLAEEIKLGVNDNKNQNEFKGEFIS